MQQGDYTSSYYHQYHHPHVQNPNPNPISNPNEFQQSPSPTTYASAPPFAPNYSSTDYQNYSSSAYPPYSQNPESIPSLPPTAPSYASNPNLQPPYNPSSFPSFSNYPPYDQPQSAPASNYTSPASIPSNPSYNHPVPSFPQVYEPSYDNRGSYLDENLGRYGSGGGGGIGGLGGAGGIGGQNAFTRTRSDTDYYEKRPESAFRYDSVGLNDDHGYGQDVYAYSGGKVEPYGARGTSGKSSAVAFDDYGRSLSLGSLGKEQVSSSKVVKAVPKVETQQDVKNGVQKFRVKLLAESGGQSTMDVLCQVGLDGIRMLDPSTSRMLRIYPLETVTRSEVTDSSIFTFWSKSSVDIEPRRIRLQSNSYTTNTILDTVTAATFQLKEMGRESFRSKPSDPGKASEQLNEKKKGLADWVNLIKPGNEEKDHWVPDEAVIKCSACGTDFGAFIRKHHCRNCGDIFCDKCTHGRIALTADDNAQPVRVCDRCMAEVTQRLSSAKESANKPASLRSHEDLAKKLQEEMERNRKASSGLMIPSTKIQLGKNRAPLRLYSISSNLGIGKQYLQVILLMVNCLYHPPRTSSSGVSSSEVELVLQKGHYFLAQT